MLSKGVMVNSIPERGGTNFKDEGVAPGHLACSEPLRLCIRVCDS